ncbi:MAG TPA: hypothetical protein P5137_04890 [Candidatus Brocadiia bacterium]|nr:hypothetical protein [Candidatus Brocadiia bacterium]
MRPLLSAFLSFLVAAASAGCGQAQPPAPQAQAPSAPQAAPSPAASGVQIETDQTATVKIILEAENGKIEAPMAVFTDATPPPGVNGPKGASGGKYAETPEPVDVDPETGKRKENIGGSTALNFTAPQTGDYYIWLRVWWRHKCANSFEAGLDGMPGLKPGSKPHQITDNTVESWRWLAVGPNVFQPAPIRLEKGEHTLKITTREDGSVLDQALVVNDPDYVPSGIEKPAP